MAAKQMRELATASVRGREAERRTVNEQRGGERALCPTVVSIWRYGLLTVRVTETRIPNRRMWYFSVCGVMPSASAAALAVGWVSSAVRISTRVTASRASRRGGTAEYLKTSCRWAAMRHGRACLGGMRRVASDNMKFNECETFAQAAGRFCCGEIVSALLSWRGARSTCPSWPQPVQLLGARNVGSGTVMSDLSDFSDFSWN